MSNYYNAFNQVGTFFGAVMLQADTAIGGHRSVFVDLLGNKNELDAPSWGGQLQNPFKRPAKFYAGDLFELRYDEKGESPKLYLLKMFKVKSTSDNTTIVLYKDGYSHVPCVGDVLMKAPKTFATKGKGYTVNNIEEAEDSWTITLAGAIDAVADGEILIEAASESTTALPLLQTVNSVAPCDADFVYMPTTNVTTKSKDAKMFYTPMMHGIMYKHKMTCGKLPECVEALNKSRFNGWYEV